MDYCSSKTDFQFLDFRRVPKDDSQFELHNAKNDATNSEMTTLTEI